MTVKIFKGIFITALCVLIVCSGIIFAICFKQYNALSDENIQKNAKYISAGYETAGISYLNSLESGVLRVTVISPNGEPIFDSEPGTPEYYLSVLSGDDVKYALEGTPETDRRKDEDGRMLVFYALALSDGNILSVSAPASSAGVLLSQMTTPIVSMITLLIIIALIAAIRLSISVLEPINAIDLEHPEKSRPNADLKLIIDKLSSQKQRISDQMDELRSREDEFKNLTENMNVGMIVINSRTEVISYNKSAEQMLGGKSTGKKSILSIKDTPEFRGAIKNAFSGMPGYDFIRTDEKYYNIAVTPVEKDGIVDGAVILMIDETEKEHRESLRREFTSNVSHELKTPLTSISGFAELIMSGLAGGEDTVHFADNIYKEAQRLITLVGDIIRLNQLDGKEIPYDGVIDLYSCAEEAVQRLQSVAAREGVKIMLEGSGTPVNGTYLILEEIIYNLIDNAIKYNREGGFVRVEVGEKNRIPTLRVSDNGIGIPQDKQDRVFERFYRVDKSHSKKIGGTGLGLSIVKHAALYHKANIALESTEGVGTAITITFPPVK